VGRLRKGFHSHHFSGICHAPCPCFPPRRLALWTAAACALLGGPAAGPAKTELLVYSALEADQIKAYKAVSKKPTPRSS
jgi:iron(III) transport system substrate-binding protein